MGRGLSDLQRYILAEAGKRERVYYADVLLGYFRWKPRNEVGRYGEGRYENDHRGERGQIVRPGAQKFSRREIGEETYRRAMATLSRACKRLEGRGLVTWICGKYSHWAGVSITDRGKAFLSVNSRENFPLN